MKISNLLILDGISGVPLGKEISEAFAQAGAQANYADLRNFRSKRFYTVAAVYKKLINRWEAADYFYHLPKLNAAEFESYIQKNRPQTVLVIGFLYKYLSPKFVVALKRKYNFSLYLYDTDSCNFYAKRREFIFFLEQELPIYDEIYSFSNVTTQFFRNTKKLPASFVPFGAKKLNLNKIIQQSNEVLFVGSCDLRRIFLLENIKDHVTIYGDRWQRNYPLISDDLKKQIHDVAVWGDQLHQLLADSKIVLNITRTQFYGAETGINLRIFEALAAGCFLLTDYCDEIAELFEIGKEIEVFRSSQELVEKVNYYLAHPAKRQEIADYGYQQFLNKHTWDIRVKLLAAKMHHIETQG